MTLWPYIQNVLSKSLQWPPFYLFTKGKCYKRFIYPRGSLSMTLIPNYLAEQIESTVRIWTETSLFCPWYSAHIWKAALKDKSTPLESCRFYFYPLFCLSSSKYIPLSYTHHFLHMLPSAMILLDLGRVPTPQQHSVLPQTSPSMALDR